VTTLRQRVLATARRRNRTVLLTYPGLGVGNYLYFALRAYLFSGEGRDYRVTLDDGVRPWLAVMPGLQSYFVEHSDVRLLERREHISPSFFQTFGDDFNGDDLDRYITQKVLPSPLFNGWHERSSQLAQDGVLTVNVRRGDYYATEAFRRIYGFDVASYVHVAVAEAHRDNGDFGRIHVVSDGVDWCRQHLPWLEDYTERVTFVGPADSPQQHLVDVALSPTLILTNSTFSYWGAYISNVIHRANLSDVWAPRFFGRGLRAEGSSAWQLDPRWSVIEDVPGA